MATLVLVARPVTVLACSYRPSHTLVAVALALVVTLLVQATTKPWLARRLGLIEGGM